MNSKAYGERTGLLPQEQPREERPRSQIVGPWMVAFVGWVVALALYIKSGGAPAVSRGYDELSDAGFADYSEIDSKVKSSIPLEGSRRWKKNVLKEIKVESPPAVRRCDWVVDRFKEKNAGETEERLKTKYKVQSQDPNVFYRATALIFWLDMMGHTWNPYSILDVGIQNMTLKDGSPLNTKSLWTWVTGDQHLSNFGAFLNRNEDVVFSVNDFDEAAPYNFHVDVIRVAVSIYMQAHNNGFPIEVARKAVRAFTNTYVETVVSYVGNNKAELFELTPETAKGALKKFLINVRDGKKSVEHQLEKFTQHNEHGHRRFIKNNETKLEKVDPRIEDHIRAAMSSTQYGATMLKAGWHIREWDDEFFKIIDIARRVRTGVGSFGVDRFYVLLKGKNFRNNKVEGHAVILDIKFEPDPAVVQVLKPDDLAWYYYHYPNEAVRAVEAQRALRTYCDEFTGYMIHEDRAFLVRERSPYKASMDVDSLTDPDEFIEYCGQVAIATATSHTRGTISKAPAKFSDVIESVLGDKQNREIWGLAVRRLAESYRKQVNLDWECFKEYVDANYSD